MTGEHVMAIAVLVAAIYPLLDLILDPPDWRQR